MATNRDVKMTLSVDTLGEDGIKSLQKSIQSLATEGGDAAPEFQKLADEVGRLGEQSQALTAFKELGNATEVLTTKQAEATKTSADLKAKLDTLKTTTQEAKVKQQEAAAALAAGQVATLEAAGALQKLKADYDNAGKQTKAFRDDQKALVDAQTAAKVALIELRTAQRDANAELATAEAAQKKAESAYTRSEKAVKATTEALTRQEAVVKEAAAATEKLGLSATDVATSEGVLLAALNKVGSEAAQASNVIKQMARDTDALRQAEVDLAASTAFDKQWQQANKLVQASEYVQFWITALDQAAAAEKRLAAIESAAKWQREADAMSKANEAAFLLRRNLEILDDAEKQLAANTAFEKQAADAKKLLQASETLGFITAELNQIKAAADKAQAAFNTLNVRSAEEIWADIDRVKSALETVKAQATATGQTMSGAFDAGKAKIQALELEMRQLNGTMTMGDKTSKLLSNSLGQISAGNLVADGVGYLVNKVKEMGQAFLDAVVQGDQMRRGLNAIYKDTTVTAQQIDFLRKTASESGVSLGALSGEFVRFSASMKSANVPMAESNALFRAVTAASASLGLGAEATSGALNALGQMASKGTVSMEELRQQLGDRLPGALGLAAQGMGITEAQLIALVSSGGLATRDFIVPFTKALETMRGEVDGLTPAWGRFGTALTTISQNAGDAGWVQILTIGLKGLAAVVGTLVMTFSLASEGVIFLAKAMTAAAARMMGDKDAFKFLAEEADKAATRINASNEALKNVINPSAAAAAATTAHAVAMTTATAEVTKAIAANASLSAEQKLLALSTALAADKTLDASAKMVQYGVAASELIGKQGQQIEAFGKLSKAAKEEGDTLVALAKLTGDVNAVQVASVQAAELHAAALDRLTQAQSSETAMLVAQKAELLANSKQRGLTDLQIKTQVDSLDALIKKSEAETAQSQQASAAAGQLVLERRLLIATTKDHSTEVDKLRAAMELAAKVSAVYEGAAKGGAVTDAQAMEKRRELTTATALYKDGLNDVVTALNAKQIAQKAASDATLIGLNAQNTYLDAVIKTARANGDEAAALSATIRQKQISIEIIKAKVAAMKAEADGAIAVANAELAVLEASGKLDPVRRAQIDASIKMAEARKLEAAAAGLAIGEIGREIDALRNGQTQLDGFRNSSANAANGQRDFAKATNAATAALEKQKGVQSTIPKATPTAFDNSFMFNVRDKLQTGKLTAADIPDVQNLVKALDQNRDMDAWAREMGGMGLLGLQDSSNWQTTNQQLKDFLANEAFKTRAANAPAAGGSATTTTGQASSGTTQTVNVVINGRSQSVNVASASDAATLTSILRSLESAANTSS